MTPQLPAATEIGRVALTVSDREAMTEFYRDVVGLSVLERTDGTTTLGVDGAALLVLEGDPGAPRRGPQETGLYHLALRVPDRATLGDALLRVRDRWQLTGASDHLVSEAVYLDDPEGNGLEIYRDRPREDWTQTPDGGVKMDTQPLDMVGVTDEADGVDELPPGSDVGHVHLAVSSLDAFESVYVETLGFERRATAPSARFVSAGGYHHHVGANTWERRSGPGDGRGLSWFEVVVPDAGIGALRDRLEASELAVRSADGGLEVLDDDENVIRVRPPRT